MLTSLDRVCHHCIIVFEEIHLNCFSSSCHCFLRVEECISQGKDSLLVDPDSIGFYKHPQSQKRPIEKCLYDRVNFS